MNPPQVYLCSPSWTLFPPPSSYPPSGSSQCTSPKHPVVCIEPGLATRFIHDIIHVSVPFSQISLPSPSPTESIRLIYTSVSLFLYMYVVLVILDKSFNFNCAYIFSFEKLRGHVKHIFSCLVHFLGLWWSKHFLCTFLMEFMKRILSLLILQIALAHKNWTSNWNLRSYNSSLW